MKAAGRRTCAGALSGAVVTAALWGLAENAVNAIGVGGALLLAHWLGGTANADLSTRYRWAGYGVCVGLLVGSAAGLCVGPKGGKAGGAFAGLFGASAAWAVSLPLCFYWGGFELLEELLSAPVVLICAGSLLLGALVGAATDFLFRRFGRRAEESSAL